MPVFQFRLVPFIVTVLLVALGLSLSYWQTQRAHQKEIIEAKLQEKKSVPAIDLPVSVDIPQMEYTRVKLTGKFVKDWPIYLDNRPMNGRVGMVVLMPFKVDGDPSTKYIFVARGWVPRNAQDRRAIKPYETSSEQIQIEGLLKASSGHVLELGKSTAIQPGEIVQNLDLDAFTRASNLPVQSFIVEQTNNAQDGLERDWPRASTGSERNRGYAFQWFALAIMAIIFFIVTGFRHGRKAN